MKLRNFMRIHLESIQHLAMIARSIFVSILSLLIGCCLSINRIIWIPNNEGIISQFLQIKAVQHFADISGSTLVSSSFTTSHIAQKKILLCDVFEIPNVRCERKWTCKVPTMHFRNASHLCLHGTIPAMGGETRRDTLLHSVKLASPKFIIQKRFLNQFDKFQRNLGIGVNDRYTVVHWRRGDQLQSRCRQKKDLSVNCGTAQELIDSTRALSKDKIIYVATNEDQDSPDLRLLESAGFKSFRHGRMGSVNVTSDSIAGLMIEVTLMLRSTTFLGWGVSLLNDLVENLRMLDHRTYCTAYSEETTLYPTWCWLRAQEQKKINKKIVANSKIVGGMPFIVLSSMNTSLMPSYELERKENYSRVYSYSVS